MIKFNVNKLACYLSFTYICGMILNEPEYLNNEQSNFIDGSVQDYGISSIIPNPAFSGSVTGVSDILLSESVIGISNPLISDSLTVNPSLAFSGSVTGISNPSLLDNTTIIPNPAFYGLGTGVSNILLSESVTGISNPLLSDSLTITNNDFVVNLLPSLETLKLKNTVRLNSYENSFKDSYEKIHQKFINQGDCDNKSLVLSRLEEIRDLEQALTITLIDEAYFELSGISHELTDLLYLRSKIKITRKRIKAINVSIRHLLNLSKGLQNRRQIFRKITSIHFKNLDDYHSIDFININ